MDAQHPSSSEPTIREKIFAFSIPESEYNERLERLRAAWEQTPIADRTFSIEKQLRAYSQLSASEKQRLRLVFQALESSQRELSTYIVLNLYSLPSLVNEPLGLRALTMYYSAYSPAASESVLRAATPFSKVEDGDWAFYAAIAMILAEDGHAAKARSFIELAKLVPHHHTAIVRSLETTILRSFHRTQHGSVKALPNLLRQPETILKTFEKADEMRPFVMPVIEHLKTSPKDLQNKRQESYYFNKFLSRAESRLYVYDFQILEQPSPQPASIWSRLPEAVIRRMACVVGFKEYLALASTCKMYHNRMNASAVWLNVLENKWDLDVMCFDPQVPRAPVWIVQQIHSLFMLNRAWWRTSAANFPQFTINSAVDVALASRPNDIIILSSADGEEVPTIAWRLAVSLICADRSGKLTSQLIENGLLDYVINTIRTDSVSEHIDLAFTILAALYTKDRSLCAQVSRFLPPTVARTLGFAHRSAGDAADSAIGFAASAMASYALFPGAHSFALPNCKPTETGRVQFIADDLDAVSASRPGEFRGAVVQPGYGSMHRVVYMVSDFLEPVRPEGSTVEMEFLSLDRVLEPSTSPLRSIADIMVMHQASLEQVSFLDRLEAEDENPTPTRADSEFKPPSNDAAVERFAAAGGEWLLFIVFSHEAFDNVLHRAVLRVSMEPQPQGTTEYPLEASGYWTIGASDTIESMTESATFCRDQYHPDFVGHRSNSARDDNKRKENWKETHALQLGEATLSSEGMIEALIEREDGEVWMLKGSGYGLGYFGGIHIMDEDSNDRLIGGFSLLKPESADPSGVGLDDLNAYERLAFASLKVGPLSHPSYSSYPNYLTTEEGDRAQQIETFNRLADQHLANTVHEALEVCRLSINNWNFETVVVEEEPPTLIISPVFDLFFVPDPLREMPGSPWQQRRAFAALGAFDALQDERSQVCQIFEREVQSDLAHLMPLLSLLATAYFPESKNQATLVDISSVMDAAAWKKAVQIHLKWVARLSLYEVAGMDLVRAICYTVKVIDKADFSELASKLTIVTLPNNM